MKAKRLSKALLSAGKTTGIAIAVAVLCTATAQGAASTFTGAVNGNWADTANWDIGYPVLDDYAILNMTANLASGTSNNIRAVRIGTSGGTGVLNVSAGGHLWATSHSIWDSHLGSDSGSSGTINQSGGTNTINYIEIGRGGTGIYNLTGGHATISRARSDYSIYLGTDDTKAVAGGGGTFEISGGVLRTRRGVWMGSTNATGLGIFSVQGAGADEIGIGSYHTLDGSWRQGPNCILRAGISTNGITPIFIDDVDGVGLGGDVVFEAGSLLDVGWMSGVLNFGTFDIMTWEGSLTDNGLAFAPGVDTTIWSFNLDEANQKLTVTAAVNAFSVQSGDLLAGSTWDTGLAPVGAPPDPNYIHNIVSGDALTANGSANYTGAGINVSDGSLTYTASAVHLPLVTVAAGATVNETTTGEFFLGDIYAPEPGAMELNGNLTITAESGANAGLDMVMSGTGTATVNVEAAGTLFITDMSGFGGVLQFNGSGDRLLYEGPDGSTARIEMNSTGDNRLDLNIDGFGGAAGNVVLSQPGSIHHQSVDEYPRLQNLRRLTANASVTVDVTTTYTGNERRMTFSNGLSGSEPITVIGTASDPTSTASDISRNEFELGWSGEPNGESHVPTLSYAGTVTANDYINVECRRQMPGGAVVVNQNALLDIGYDEAEAFPSLRVGEITVNSGGILEVGYEQLDSGVVRHNPFNLHLTTQRGRSGDLTLATGSTTTMQISDLTDLPSGMKPFDTISAEGDVSLGGTLELLINPALTAFYNDSHGDPTFAYVPTDGDVFEIVSLVAETLPTDLDGNGSVGSEDIALWDELQGNSLASGDHDMTADVDGNGVTDILDRTAIQNDLGTSGTLNGSIIGDFNSMSIVDPMGVLAGFTVTKTVTATNVTLTINNPLVVDSDHDGLTDVEEVNTYGTDPLDPDSDDDGMPDGWEVGNALDPLADDSGLDPDYDDLVNGQEYAHGTNPNDNDTDDDDMPDGYEVSHGLDPLIDDTGLDPDSDGLTSWQEYFFHDTHPNDADTDDDGLSDGIEVLNNLDPLFSNIGQDVDEDGLSDIDEVLIYGTDPQDSDSDADVMHDGYEVSNGLDPLYDDSGLDPDFDGLTNIQEYIHSTDPQDSDSDGDGLADGAEINTYGTDPLDSDSDDDGLLDGEEINTYGTDPLDVDTDGDLISDGNEVNNGLNPLVSNLGMDSDSDGLNDRHEVNTYGTDPLDPDSDDDGLLDGKEFSIGTDPLDPDSDDDGFTDYEEISALTDPNDPADVPLHIASITVDGSEVVLDIHGVKAGITNIIRSSANLVADGPFTNWTAADSLVAAATPLLWTGMVSGASQEFYGIEAITGPLFFDDFEGADLGWHIIFGVGSLWEKGTPNVNFPPFIILTNAASGVNCYGTDLNSPYVDNTDTTLLSPPIIPGTSTVVVEWTEAYDIEDDLATVSVIDENAGTTNVIYTIDTSSSATTPSHTWLQRSVTLPPAHAGHTIRILFRFQEEGVNWDGTYAGWFIDDVAVKEVY